MSDWLIYGANGYTGTLIAEEAVRRGLKPVLGGRRADAIEPLAKRLGLETHVFSVEKADVSRYKAVLHAAGPFTYTSRPMVDACLVAKAHYLDITGELDVFEAIFARDAEAKAAGVVLLPGTGVDVVPTDCIAAFLKEALPDATSLELALASGGRASRGTMRTAVEHLKEGGAVRQGGRIVREPIAARTRKVPFRDHPRHAISIPWGDVSTAYRSTGIPDIVVYNAAPKAARWVTKLPPRLLRFLVDRLPAGPTNHETKMHFWGRVTSPTGSREATVETPEGYKLTAVSAVTCLERILAGQVPPGAHTPATAFGARFVSELPGCDLQQVSF